MKKYKVSLLNNIIGYGIATGVTAWVASQDVLVFLSYFGVGIIYGFAMTLLFAEAIKE